MRRDRNERGGRAGVLVAVEGPVVIEVAAGGEGAEFEDGFGTVQSPSGAGDVHAVFHKMPACSFDDPGGDGPALSEGGGVAQVVLLGSQIGRASVGAFALGAGVALGAVDDGGGHQGRGDEQLGQDGHNAACGTARSRAGMTPSCWNTSSRLSSSQCSANSPSWTRQMSIDRIWIGRPVGGMP